MARGVNDRPTTLSAAKASARAAQSGPIAVGQQQRHVIVGAWCDEHHVRTGHVEMSLQVMVEVPRNDRRCPEAEFVGNVAECPLLGCLIIQADHFDHLGLSLSGLSSRGFCLCRPARRSTSVSHDVSVSSRGFSRRSLEDFRKRPASLGLTPRSPPIEVVWMPSVNNTPAASALDVKGAARGVRHHATTRTSSPWRSPCER